MVFVIADPGMTCHATLHGLFPGATCHSTDPSMLPPCMSAWNEAQHGHGTGGVLCLYERVIVCAPLQQVHVLMTFRSMMAQAAFDHDDAP
jgi:hypothetical protein